MSQVLPGVGVMPHQCDDAEEHRRCAKNEPSVKRSFHREKVRLSLPAARTFIASGNFTQSYNRIVRRGHSAVRKAGAGLPFEAQGKPHSKVLLGLAEGLEVD